MNEYRNCELHGNHCVTCGDEAQGARGVVLEYGHTAVWVLLTAALALTAVGRGPRWLPRTIGYASLAVYACFLAALVFGG